MSSNYLQCSTHVNGQTGRGIYIGSGYLSIKNCIISGNSVANFCGGGINNNGNLTIIGYTISDNTATNYGGGICNMYYHNGSINLNSLTINGSTIFGNSTDEWGGGLYIY